MKKTCVIDAVARLRSYTDVIYLTNQNRIPREIKWLLKQKRVSFAIVPPDSFPQLLDRLDLIGTVVIDVCGLDVSRQQKLARIVESLEVNNIGIILLSNRMVLPVKSFSLASPAVKSFSLVTTMETVSVELLWKKISENLEYRKKNMGIVAKPPSLQNKVERNYGNKLAEQLHITETLASNLAEQLRMAGLVQRDFLPAQLPHTNEAKWAAVFEPAEWVSGDIYDIVRLDEQHIGFYVADAVGHSMPAALLTIFLKQALVMKETVETNYRIFSPAQVMRSLNMKMAAQKLSGYQFATCCYCLLNRKTLQMTFARAGHPYPVLLRPNQPPQQLEVRGALLGIFEQAEFAQQTIQLHPGDKILLYSDGMDPFMGQFDDSKGFQFSEKFLELKDLSITEMFEQLNNLVKSEQISPYEVDDITAVGVEIQ